MEALQSLPSWAVVLLALLAAAVLIALNIGWLLSAKAMLDARRRNPDSSTPTPSDAAKREGQRTVRDTAPTESGPDSDRR